MIFNENYDYLFNVLAGSGDDVRGRYERRRYNRAMLALRCQNWFQWVSFTSATQGSTGTAVTDVLEKPLIVRGGGMNAFAPLQDDYWSHNSYLAAMALRIMRSGSNRAQINLDFLPATHYVSVGNGQKWSLDWPIPWVLFPNEAIKVDFLQTGNPGIDTDVIYNIGFYGLVVDPNYRCSGVLMDSIKDQIRKTDQFPRYIHVKSDKGGGTLTFPANDDTNDQQINANTIEVPEHMLVLGFRRANVDIKNDLASVQNNTTFKLLVSGGAAFSKVEIPVNAVELFTRPDAGYYHFSVPHFLPRGSSIGLSITGIVDSLIEQYAGEIELLCVSV